MPLSPSTGESLVGDERISSFYRKGSEQVPCFTIFFPMLIVIVVLSCQLEKFTVTLETILRDGLSVIRYKDPP